MRGKLCVLSLLSAAIYVSAASAAETIRITIDKLAFSPPRIAAHVGDTIEWVSTDFIAHTATARSKDWDVAIPAKGSSRIVMTRQGDVDYFCRFHPNMTGHITIEP